MKLVPTASPSVLKLRSCRHDTRKANERENTIEWTWIRNEVDGLRVRFSKGNVGQLESIGRPDFNLLPSRKWQAKSANGLGAHYRAYLRHKGRGRGGTPCKSGQRRVSFL